MKVIKFILTLVLLAAWLPATVHCELEAAGLVPMDRCCETEAPGDHRCDTGCNIVEDGGYKTECQTTLPSPPDILVLLPELCALASSESASETQTRSEIFQIHLPQFVIRTSLPIRGPSFAS